MQLTLANTVWYLTSIDRLVSSCFYLKGDEHFYHTPVPVVGEDTLMV